MFSKNDTERRIAEDCCLTHMCLFFDSFCKNASIILFELKLRTFLFLLWNFDLLPTDLTWSTFKAGKKTSVLEKAKYSLQDVPTTDILRPLKSIFTPSSVVSCFSEHHKIKQHKKISQVWISAIIPIFLHKSIIRVGVDSKNVWSWYM